MTQRRNPGACCPRGFGLAAAILVAASVPSLVRADGIQLPSSSCTKPLLAACSKVHEAKGLKVRVSYVDDAYLYRLCRGIDELRSKDLVGKELEKALVSVRRRARLSRGRAVFVVSLETSSSDRTYWFLQNAVAKHVRVRTVVKTGKKAGRASKKTVQMLDAPKVKVQKWRIWESRPDPPKGAIKFRNPYHTRKLGRFDKLAFGVLAKWTKADRDTRVEVALAGLARQTAADRSDRGVDLKRRHVSCSNFRDLVLRDIVLSFDLAAWKLPKEIADLETLFKRIEAL